MPVRAPNRDTTQEIAYRETSMSIEVWAMSIAGLTALLAGLILVRPRFNAASGAGRILVLGPVFEAVALAMFAAEHFTAAHDLAPIVPRWLGHSLFWTWFFGFALLAAAISFLLWRYVRWSSLLLALFFLLVVSTVSLPALPTHLHDRFAWILTVRETCFAAGALVLAGSTWPRSSAPGKALIAIGRSIVAAAFVFYAIEHFLFPHHVPGVPLENITPSWMPAPVFLSCLIGLTLLLTGMGLLIPRTTRLAAATAGAVLVLLVVFFYVPILATEIHTPLAVEGLNYVGDTLLFAATALLAGFGPD